MPNLIAYTYAALLTDDNRTGVSNDIAVPDVAGLETRTVATGDVVVDIIDTGDYSSPDPVVKVRAYTVTEDGDWLAHPLAAGDVLVGTAIEAGTQSGAVSVVLADGESARPANWGRILLSLAGVGRAITETFTP